MFVTFVMRFCWGRLLGLARARRYPEAGQCMIVSLDGYHVLDRNDDKLVTIYREWEVANAG